MGELNKRRIGSAKKLVIGAANFIGKDICQFMLSICATKCLQPHFEARLIHNIGVVAQTAPSPLPKACAATETPNVFWQTQDGLASLRK
jgi:hypothetical protein